MKFLILDLPLDSKLFSCFLFLFLDMRSLHQPISWRSRAKWTLLPRHRVCSPCWFKEPRQEPCWIEVPCFMRVDVPKWCHSSKSSSFSFPKSIGKEVAFKTQVTNFNPESATQASGKDSPLELDNETCLKHTRFWLHIFDCLNTYLRIWSFFGLVFDWNFRLTTYFGYIYSIYRFLHGMRLKCLKWFPGFPQPGSESGRCLDARRIGGRDLRPFGFIRWKIPTSVVITWDSLHTASLLHGIPSWDSQGFRDSWHDNDMPKASAHAAVTCTSLASLSGRLRYSLWGSKFAISSFQSSKVQCYDLRIIRNPWRLATAATVRDLSNLGFILVQKVSKWNQEMWIMGGSSGILKQNKCGHLGRSWLNSAIRRKTKSKVWQKFL